MSAVPLAPSCLLIGRLVRSADFERVLRSPARAKTQHFAVHHLADHPSRPEAPKGAVRAKLSTSQVPGAGTAVDDLLCPRLDPAGLWLGAVVPKRHARRSVTRNLIKRRIRAAMAAQVAGLDKGLWVIRLRAPFDKARYLSAASALLEEAASTELATAMRHAVKPTPKR